MTLCTSSSVAPNLVAKSLNFLPKVGLGSQPVVKPQLKQLKDIFAPVLIKPPRLLLSEHIGQFIVCQPLGVLLVFTGKLSKRRRCTLSTKKSISIVLLYRI